jgi:UDP-GlcNAc3NAcA epimerase
MKIISIVGTRPQFIKVSILDKELTNHNVDHIIINTGQHYDKEMSGDIFKILFKNVPKYNLNKIGETNVQTLSNMMIEIDKILIKECPDKVIVYGDCDTTLAGALVSHKNNIFLVHIESGMRSYNKNMPEENNRVLVDNISNLLLCSDKNSIINLKNENINKCYYVGNLHLELLNSCINNNLLTNDILKKFNINDNFIVLTIHRNYNTSPENLKKILMNIEKINKKIIFLCHPRTKNIIKKLNLNLINITVIPPINYLDLMSLVKKSEYVITDSGGLQSECWFLKKKCFIYRKETEWIDPIKYKNNILIDYTRDLSKQIEDFLKVPIINTIFNTNVSSEIIKHIKK